MVSGSSVTPGTAAARSERSSRASSRGLVFFDFLSVLRARSVIMVEFPSTRKYGGRWADTLCPCRIHQQIAMSEREVRRLESEREHARPSSNALFGPPSVAGD